MEIKLIDLRKREIRRNLFQANRSQRRDAEHRAEFFDGTRDGALALMMKQPLQGRRRAIKGHRQLMPHDGDREIDLRNTGQNVWHEIAFFERERISSVSRLILGSAVDIIEDRAGQTTPRKLSEVMIVVTTCQPHTVSNKRLDVPARAPLVMRPAFAGAQQADRGSRSRRRNRRASWCRRRARRASRCSRWRSPAQPMCAVCGEPRSV